MDCPKGVLKELQRRQGRGELNSDLGRNQGGAVSLFMSCGS
jgi:hypothetical protein